MKGTPYSIRNNEFYGDMAAWLRANAQDNDGELLRLKPVSYTHLTLPTICSV